MNAAEINPPEPTPPNAAVLPPKIAKLIAVQRATITLLFSSLLVVAFYAHAAQSRAVHWKTETDHLQAQRIQTALAQTEQNETTWIQNAEAGANGTPDGKSEPQVQLGMTRADAERVLMPDGGPHAIDENRYILGTEPTLYPGAPATELGANQKVVKITVRYMPNNLAGMISPSFSEARNDDVITSISEPYLEEPF